MTGEKNLATLLQTMKPQLHTGNYVYCTLPVIETAIINEALLLFREEEGITIILKQEVADAFNIPYNYITAWISLTVHSSLEAVGLTAAFSKALAENNISCNVVAGYYHHHLFVESKEAKKAMDVLNKLSTWGI
jgi:uncharacterized protein